MGDPKLVGSAAMRPAPSSDDDHHLLTRFKTLAQVAEIYRNAALGGDDGSDVDEACAGSPGDLRGLPAIGRGSAGAIRGMQHEAETIRRLSPRRTAE